MKYAIVIIFAISMSGCSVALAINKPSMKDVSKIVEGSSIHYASTVLKTTYVSEQKFEDGSRVYFYNYTQGYSSIEKAARATVYLIADVFTLCLWELIGTPFEMVFNGTEETLQIKTDSNGVITEVLHKEE